MTDMEIVISDLEDIARLLNNNGYARLGETIPDAIAMLKEQDAKIKSLEQTIEDICCGGGAG